MSHFIATCRLLINEMLKYDEVDLDDMFFGNPPDIGARWGAFHP